MKKILLLLMGLIPLLGIGQTTQGITFETVTLKSSITELSPKTNQKTRANALNPGKTNISKETNLTINGLCTTPADQDFGNYSDITYGASIDYQCIVYSGSDCSVAIGDISSQGISASPVFSGSAAVILGNSAGGYGEFYSTNGYNFKLVSFAAEFFGHSNGYCTEIYNVVGYRDNDEVVRVNNFRVTESGTAGSGTATITWVREDFDTDGSNSGVLSFGAGWQNIDKIRFEVVENPGYYLYIGLDNINFEVAVSASIPTITTASITIFNATSATMGGEVTTDGGASVTERGVVYSSSDNTPEIGETGVIKNDNGTGTGIFGESVSGLSPNTTYHVRAYAINSAGTAYADVVTFTTAPEADPLQTVYWPNYEGDKIEGISITGTNRATVVSATAMDPISIEIDAENNKVYWLSQSDTKIYRADTDGSNIETFVADPGYATTLFLDRKNGYLYWPNYEAAKIERIKIDGSLREDVASTPQPIAVTVDLTNDKVYWFDQADNKIHRADLDGNNPEIFVSDPGYASTLYFDQTNKRLYWPNYEAAKIERIDIDGNSRQDVVNTPQPISITADITNGKIYWFDQDDNNIHRADLDGNNPEIFVTDPGFATTIVLPYSIPSATIPEVTTASITVFNATSATMGGEVTADGGASVTERGVVYSSSDNTPEIGETGVIKDDNGTGTGIFEESITGLSPNTTYHVRAYATNTAGTAYGDDVTFTTLTNGTFTGTASNDWATAGNWAGGSIPTAGTDVIIPTGKTTEIAPGTSANCNNITIDAAGSLTIKSDASNAGSLIVAGTATGNVTYQSYLAETGKWHVVTAPVAGQNVWGFATLAGNSIAEKTGKRAVTEYIEATNTWDTNYPTADTEGSFAAGSGYSVLRSDAGVVSYTGTINTSDVSKSITRSLYGWNALGNPYTSAINATETAHATNNLITANTDKLDPVFAALYVWDAASGQYVTINNTGTGTLVQNYIQAGQGFFVRAKDNSGLNFSITEAMQTHQPATPLKSAENTWPTILLTAKSNNKLSSTMVTFNSQMTNGLDVTYDAGMFKADKNFALYSKLVDDNGNDFAIQALPEKFEGLIIPLGIDAPAGTEISFSAGTFNLPAEATVYLEDRASNRFTKLDATEAVYTVTITEQTKGAGNFFLHTSAATTGIEDQKNGIQVYTRDRAIFVNGNLDAKDVVAVYGIDGKLHYKNIAGQNGLLRIDAAGLPAGVYLVSISQKAGRVTHKIILGE